MLVNSLLWCCIVQVDIILLLVPLLPSDLLGILICDPFEGNCIVACASGEYRELMFIRVMVEVIHGEWWIARPIDLRGCVSSSVARVPPLCEQDLLLLRQHPVWRACDKGRQYTALASGSRSDVRARFSRP